MLSARFILPKARKADFIMDANAGDEIGNQPPKALPEMNDIPFSLDMNQAVLSYHLAGKFRTLYYRIKDIKEGQALIMPSRPH